MKQHGVSMGGLAGLLGGGGAVGGDGGGGGIMQVLGKVFGGGGVGGGMNGGGGGSWKGLANLLQGGQMGSPQAMSNYQQVFTGGVPMNPNQFPPDFPPANIGPTPHSFAPDIGQYNPDFHEPTNFRDFTDNPAANFTFNNLTGFGTSPSTGFSAFGNTMLPTFWVNYPGVGNVPMAVPTTGWAGDPSQGQSGAMLNPHQIRAKGDA